MVNDSVPHTVHSAVIVIDYDRRHIALQKELDGKPRASSEQLGIRMSEQAILSKYRLDLGIKLSLSPGIPNGCVCDSHRPTSSKKLLPQ